MIQGFRIETSPSKWACNWRTKTLLLPPPTHPDYQPVLRHELQHVKEYYFYRRHKIPLRLVIILYFFFDGFYELVTCYNSQTLSYSFGKPRGWLLIMKSICWLVNFLVFSLIFFSELLK